MFRAVVLFCAVLALTKGQLTTVNQCTPSSGPLPLLTAIQGCRTQPCLLPQGQETSIRIAFVAPHAIQQMRTTAVAFLGIIPIPYDLGENSQTCNYLTNTYCPVEAEELMIYNLRLYIGEWLPVGTQLPIEIRILDDNGDAVTCIRVTIRITPPVDNQLGAQNAALTAEV